MKTHRIFVGSIQVECKEGEDILGALRRDGCREVRVGCRRGGCGVCKVQLLAGDVKHGCTSVAHVSVAERQEGWGLACRMVPQSDVTISVPEVAVSPLVAKFLARAEARRAPAASSPILPAFATS